MCGGHDASTWPMYDGSGRIIGIRLREMAGDRKWTIRDSRAGLFLPRNIPTSADRLFVVEGPSDLAAALDLQLPCIGRPSCSGLTQEIRCFMLSTGFHHATIVADNDTPGIQGAIRLGSDLSKWGIGCDVITSLNVFDDLRSWVQASASRAAVQSSKPIRRFAGRSVKTQMCFDFGLVGQVSKIHSST